MQDPGEPAGPAETRRDPGGGEDA